MIDSIRYRFKFFSKTLLFGMLLFLQTPNYGQADCRKSVGVNLGEMNGALVDVFKTARRFWESRPDQYVWDTGRTLSLSADGYPQELEEGFAARTLLLEALQGNYPTGDYALFYDGTGVLELGMDAENQQLVTNNGVDNEIHFSVNTTTNEGIMLDIRATDPEDPVRNIRIIRPDESGTDYRNTYLTSPFRPIFLERLKQFSVLRFMDWQGTNFSPLQHWEDRTRLSSQTWSTNFGEGGGAPLEIMIALCNETGAAPWFCMPHQADDDFVREFARQVRDQLAPEIPIYLEYSNEVWNNIFSDNAWWNGQTGQYSYARAQGDLYGWNCPGCSYWEAIGRWVAQRSVEIFEIWNDVFGDDQDRIVKVLPIQNGPGNATPFTLDHEVNGVPAYQYADAVAGAPYFGGGISNISGLANWSVTQVVDAIQADMFKEDSGPYWAEQAIALLNSPPYAEKSLQYLAYEGGQHLFNFFGGPTDDLSLLFRDVNRHPQMRTMYYKYLDWWQNAGGGTMVFYNHVSRPGQGSFGLLEYIDQDTLTAPKWLAVQRYLANDCEIPNENGDGAPLIFSLRQNYPNPFNMGTTIEYTLSRAMEVCLTIYDVTGKRVTVLEDAFKEAGTYSIEFQAEGLASGLYVYRMQIGQTDYRAGKMLLIR